MLGVLFINLPALASEDGFNVTDSSENEIHVRVMPAQGDLLAIWLEDHVEERIQFENMLKAINALGIEVWRVDLMADYFLPRSSENVRTMSGDGVAALIRAAHRQSNKNIILAAYDRMPLPLLRGVRQWQQSHKGESRLAGAVLFYPNLFGPPPVAGEDPELDTIVRATNIPVTVYQPENGSHRWRLPEVMEGFWGGGSPAFVYLAPDVRDWFFMHPPDEDPAEQVATVKVPGNLLALARLMGLLPKPTSAVPMGRERAVVQQVQELVALEQTKSAPAFDLKDVFGGRTRFEDSRGRVTLINFWATWCPPCVEEVPSLNQLAQRYAEREFSVVSIDFRESEKVIQKFAKQVPVEFPVLLDSDGRVSLDWKVFSFPSSFIVDRSGRIRYSANRAIDWNTPDVWAVIDALLSEPR